MASQDQRLTGGVQAVQWDFKQGDELENRTMVCRSLIRDFGCDLRVGLRNLVRGDGFACRGAGCECSRFKARM